MGKEKGNGEVKFVQIIMRVFLGVLGTITVLVLGWAVTSILDHEKRLTTTEANRWTIRDHDDYAKEQNKVNMELLTTMSEMRASMPDEYPPHEFVKRFDGLEQTVDDIDDTVHAIEVEVAKIAEKF